MVENQNLTLLSIYTEYIAQKESINDNRMLTSLFVRYLVPAFGGASPNGRRATSDEVRAAQDYLKGLQPSCLLEASRLLEETFEEKKVNKNNRRSWRFVLRGFVDWAIANGYCALKTAESDFKPSIPLRRSNGEARIFSNNNHGRKHKQPYVLMGRHNQTKLRGQLIFPGDYINEALQMELKAFNDFILSKGLSAATLRINHVVIFRVLGWLHRYKGVPLEKLSLCCLVPYRKLNISLSECLQDGRLDLNLHFYKKAEQRQLAVEEANETKKIISEYFRFSGGHVRSDFRIIQAWISIAKFIFREEVGTDDYENYQDIPIIRKLHAFQNDIREQCKSSIPAVPHHRKSIPWEKVIQILEALRQRADTLESVTKPGDKIYKKKRRDGGIFHDLQSFLLIGLMTLMPPDRARTYCDLQIGRTLVQGMYNRGIFTPKEKMVNPTLAEWYIHLSPDDYKTGKTYGDWWAAIPNTRFADGSEFYQYIDTWITKGRDYKGKCNHNFFFRGDVNFKKLDVTVLNGRLKSIFLREAEVPVTPKEIRKMYVTFLKDSGATEAELEAAACWMHHSRDMQSKIYDEQDKVTKMAPITVFNNRMLEKLLVT